MHYNISNIQCTQQIKMNVQVHKNHFTRGCCGLTRWVICASLSFNALILEHLSKNTPLLSSFIFSNKPIDKTKKKVQVSSESWVMWNVRGSVNTSQSQPVRDAVSTRSGRETVASFSPLYEHGEAAKQLTTDRQHHRGRWEKKRTKVCQVKLSPRANVSSST